VLSSACLALAPLWAETEVVPPPPEVRAASAFLVQARSGAVLYEKAPLEARPPASLTKMVTALLVVERCGLDDIATVSAGAASAEGSTVGLRAGERIPIRELLKALMLPSANDAAQCLAEHVAGSESAFSELMNAKAAELGAVNTHFVNASGLTAEGHYSCARDLAIFALAVRQHPYLSQVIGSRSATVRWRSGRAKTVYNLNRLLSRCAGCDGVKTGFTTPAGRCLAASAERNGYALVSIVLRSPDSWTESGALLNWGFAQPPVAILEVPGQAGGGPVRIPSPLVDDRLCVPVADLEKALGLTPTVADGQVTASVAGLEVAASVGQGLLLNGSPCATSTPLALWRGMVTAPATDLCRLFGLHVSFDKTSLTGHISAHASPENTAGGEPRVGAPNSPPN
jgi:D-alanyl-D-alanine carboxypeptidase